MARIDQVQVAQAHRLHRARRRADIARMGGVAEHDTDVCQRIMFIQNAIPTKMTTLILSLIKLKDLRTT